MSAKAKHVAQSSKTLAPVIVFGIDGHGKPKAARFGKDHAGLAVKAANQLQLRVLPGDHPKVADLFGRLPVGRVHATGRTFVPFVRRDLYDKLVAIAAPHGNGHQSSASAGSGAAGSSSSASGPNRPRDRQAIGPGDLVIAQESLEEGWYDAIVVSANGDMVTVRWRDYPGGRTFTRHRHRLGLVYPGPKPATEPARSGKPSAASKHAKSETAGPGTEQQGLPNDWDTININHLVLAKDDGPWASWWEAIPVEKVGEAFKVRWRDHSDVLPVIRSRYDLALISPT